MIGKLSTATSVAALVAAFGLVGPAMADPFADAVVSLNRVTTGTSATGAAISTAADTDEFFEGGTDATGAPDAGTFRRSVSLGIDQKGTATTADDDRGVIVLDFTDNLCVGVGGNDIRLFENGNNEGYTLEVAYNGGAFSAPTPGFGTASVDLADVFNGDLFDRVRITATSFAGVARLAGADVDAIQCLAAVTADDFVATNTGPDTFEIGSSEAQYFQYEIKITNNTGADGALDGLIVLDVIPAEFDLDPDGEAAAGGNNSCADAGGCDGIAEDDRCPVTVSGHGNGRDQLEPQSLSVEIGLDSGESCTTTVFLAVDGDRGNKQRTAGMFKPTSCELVMQGPPDVFNTITLNEGIKVFDVATGDLVFGPSQSIQLVADNCP